MSHIMLPLLLAPSVVVAVLFFSFMFLRPKMLHPDHRRVACCVACKRNIYMQLAHTYARRKRLASLFINISVRLSFVMCILFLSIHLLYVIVLLLIFSCIHYVRDDNKWTCFLFASVGEMADRAFPFCAQLVCPTQNMSCRNMFTHGLMGIQNIGMIVFVATSGSPSLDRSNVESCSVMQTR